MFSQRNNPYCELLQNCTTIIQQYFNIGLRFSVRIVIFFLLNLKFKILIQNSTRKKINYEKNIRIGFGDNLNWMGIY